MSSSGEFSLGSRSLRSVFTTPDEESSAPYGDNLEEKHERKLLAFKENKAVHCSRLTILFGLCVTATIVSLSTFFQLSNSQADDFAMGFEAHATSVIDSFHTSIQVHLEAIDALSVTYTSHALTIDAQWPNVTLPNFEIRSASTRVLSGSPFLNFYPVVTDESRAGWEAYQIENRDYYDASLTSGFYQRAHQDARFQHLGRRLQDEQDPPLRDQIENLDPRDGTYYIPEVGSGPYLPIWQMSPAVPMKVILNFNALSHPAGAPAFRRVLDTQKAALAAAQNIDGEHLGRSGDYFRTLLSLGQYRYDIDKLILDPTSSLGYPVFDSFNHESRQLVGMIATNMYWRLIFRNILPDKARGVMVVLENTQGQSLTYRIDGDLASYVGPKDLHDPTYDSFGRSGNFAKYLRSVNSPETQSYTSVDLDSDFCDYTIHVYPSVETEAEYVDRFPFVLTLLVAGAFLFTSLVFVAYDCLVARRQRIVMNRAMASSAIVSSLFPSYIREQIYQESKWNENMKSTWQTFSPVSTFRNARDTLDSNGGVAPKAMNELRPIASEFERTTILFADLAGFTRWSSNRTPVQVFELLETLYCAFDRIAAQHNVFKVETVGDCYVAVAGVPEPQDDHAVIMSKFAQHIMVKTQTLVKELATSLGKDTADLEMRVGLHSGAVTGGVLRGQKSRFQLFGDSMNTASRMESNGERGKIHVSESTARALQEKGKSAWLTLRSNRIAVKGKGEMQTYWLNMQKGAQLMSAEEEIACNFKQSCQESEFKPLDNTSNFSSRRVNL